MVSFANPSRVVPSGLLVGNANVLQTQAADQYDLEVSLQIGALHFPNRPISNLQQFWYYLSEAVETYGLTSKTINITPERFEKQNWVCGLNMNRVPQISSSAVSTRSGDACVFQVKNMRPGMVNPRVFFTFLFAAYISVSERSVTLFD